MALNTIEKEINGKRFTISQLPAMRALKLSTRLGKLFGPAMAKVAGAGPPKAFEDMNLEALSPAVAMLFENLTESEIESLTKELLGSALAQLDGNWVELFGKAPTFDLVMGGDVLGIYRLLYAAIEVNYSDFFDALRGLVTAVTASPSAGSNTSRTDGKPTGS